MRRRETEAGREEVLLAEAQDMDPQDQGPPGGQLTPPCLGSAWGLSSGPLRTTGELSGPGKWGFWFWGHSHVEVTGALTFPMACMSLDVEAPHLDTGQWFSTQGGT